MKDKQHNQNQLLNKNLLTRGRTGKKKDKMDSQRTPVNPEAIFTPKAFEEVVPKLLHEAQRQYEALRLYCQEDSLIKARQRLNKDDNTLPRELFDSKGNLPSLRTLERWSKRYYWVERKDDWITEECRRLDFLFPKNSKKITSLVNEVEKGNQK